MDYLDFNQAGLVWPFASTFASFAGIALMFGRGLGQGVSTLLIPMVVIFQRVLSRIAQPWLASAILLIVPLVVPSVEWVNTVRGLTRVDSELESARTDGYYEDLIRSKIDHPKTEVDARPINRRTFADSGLVVEVADYRRRILRPNLHQVWNEIPFRTNALGFRGPEISREKPPGTFRVVVLGSSNTMGHGIADEDSYPRRLEAWIAGQIKRGRKAEVINLAVSGDSPTQRLIRLMRDVPQLDPDWILCDLTALDLALEEQHLRWAIRQGVISPFDFVRSVIASSGIVGSESRDDFHEKLRPFLKPMLETTISRWAIETKRIDVPLTVVILPRADSKSESSEIFRLYRDMLDRHDISRIDLSHTFDRHELDAYRIASWDHHPNVFGHRLIFARLLDGLLGNPNFRDQIQ